MIHVSKDKINHDYALTFQIYSKNPFFFETKLADKGRRGPNKYLRISSLKKP